MFVPINSNENSRSYAIITFENQKKLEKAKSKPLRYNNYIAFWDGYNPRKKISKEERRNIRYSEEGGGNTNYEMDFEYLVEKEVEDQTEKQRGNPKGKQVDSRNFSTEELLIRILNRLDKLEVQQESRFASHRFANRS